MLLLTVRTTLNTIEEHIEVFEQRRLFECLDPPATGPRAEYCNAVLRRPGQDDT